MRNSHSYLESIVIVIVIGISNPSSRGGELFHYPACIAVVNQ